MTSQAINLGNLKTRPTVIKPQSVAEIETESAADLARRFPPIAENLQKQSDPSRKLLQTAALREQHLVGSINAGAFELFLATAQGDALDHFGADKMPRRVIDPVLYAEDPANKAAFEDDEEYRARLAYAPYIDNKNGTGGAYIINAWNAHAEIKSVDVFSPSPIELTVSILSRHGGGTPSAEALDAVRKALAVPGRTAQGDVITVQAATILEYTVTAELDIGSGPDADLVLEAAKQALDAYALEQNKHGRKVSHNGLHKALSVAGVLDVTITSPVGAVNGEKAGAEPNNEARVPLMKTKTITRRNV